MDKAYFSGAICAYCHEAVTVDANGFVEHTCPPEKRLEDGGYFTSASCDQCGGLVSYSTAYTNIVQGTVILNPCEHAQTHSKDGE